MSNDVERWKSLDAASYDDVAERFDEHSNRLSTGAAERLLRLASAKAGERVLDVGTGAGLLPFALIRSGAPVGAILGVDISTGMIAAARKKAAAANLPDHALRFEQMDAERLDLADASFDVVLSAFALTHVPHPDVALAEIFRVLRPGGRLAVVLGSRPALASVDTVIHALAELRRRAEILSGRRLTADLLDRIIIDDYGPAPHDLPKGSALSRQLNRAELLVELVKGAGFAKVARSWKNYQNEIDSADEFWDIHRTIRSDARKRLLDAPADMVDAVRGRFIRECNATLAKGGVMTFPISAVFVVAHKPVQR